MQCQARRQEISMTAYDARLGTRISNPVARRLRLLVVVRRQPLNRVLTDLLDQALPTLAELTDQLKGQGSDDR
jgi:hypothetical protein